MYNTSMLHHINVSTKQRSPTSTSMFFVNNYSVFLLSITCMAFNGLHDADPSDPSILVLQDRHRSQLVDTKQVCILLNINYYYISLV